MIKAVLFDFDGVIADSERLQVEAEQSAAAAMATEMAMELDMEGIDWTKFRGWARLKIAAELFGVEPEHEIAEDYRLRVVDHTLEVMGDHNLSHIDGIRPFLVHTRWHLGNLAIATSSHRRILDSALDFLDLGSYFTDTVANREALDDKPGPGQYAELMRRANLRPDETLVIEDSASGITAGRFAGATVLAIATTKSADFLQSQTGAHMVAENYEQAVHLIDPLLPR